MAFSSLSPIFADIYMHDFQNAFVQKNLSLLDTLHWWHIYINWHLSPQADRILQIMNFIDINIQFTYKIQKNGVLSFLDTLFSCMDEEFFNFCLF